MAELTADRVERLKDADVFIYHGKIYIPASYTAGAVGSRFLIEMRDNKKIMGTRCVACDLVYVPARSVCKHCFAQLDKWVEVSDRGTLQTYTVAGQANGVQPVDPPIIYGVVLLDGASTGLVHMISGVDFEKLAVGMRVKAVFAEKRVGSILDIKYFAPL
ncbi:MAG: Zn-ribbon domain-containing OB-fold protein [Chloroflexi bacterium]|nr:Zn-ribbon domain-containing OB-fold protein [Chloroflexota bacterium]